MERTSYNLSHGGFGQMKLGRVFCIQCLPTLPGDQISWDGHVYIEMETLKHRLSLRARVDIATFWVPHRATDSNFEAMLVDGLDSATALQTTGNPTLAVEWLPYWNTNPTSKPNWYMNGPLQIFNRFFKPLTEDIADATWSTGPWNGALSEDDFTFGFPAANLPEAIWTQTTNRDLAAADLEITLGSELDLTEISEKQARLKTERHRQFEDVFYQGVVERFGGSTTIDAEPRPEKIWHDSFFMGGEVIRGTDYMTIGNEGGKHIGRFRHRIPNRYIPEHGCIWTMGVVRYPPFSTTETHFLLNHNDYLHLAADPDVIANYPPHALQVEDIFDTASDTTQISHIPFGHWYRQQPNFAHTNYKDQKGFTFAQGTPSVDVGMNFYKTDIDIENFISHRFGHGRISVDWEINANRYLPPMEASVYAGANL